MFNNRYFNSSLPLGKSCILGHYLPWDQRTALMQAACARIGEHENAEVLALRQRLAPCHIIIDDIPDELYEGFNGCIRPFVRERLGGIAERRLGRQRKLSVGIHIRWGDTANPEGGMTFRGSMDIVHINNIVRDARERFGPLDIKLVMENHDSMVLDHLNFGDYELVDTGDSVADLKTLADNDLLLLGGSSYGATAHLLAPPGLTIVEGGEDVKYKDTGECAAIFSPHLTADFARFCRARGDPHPRVSATIARCAQQDSRMVDVEGRRESTCCRLERLHYYICMIREPLPLQSESKNRRAVEEAER